MAMKSSDFQAITLYAVARPSDRFDRMRLFELAARFIESVGGEVERVSGKKGYVSFKRVRKRLASLLSDEAGFSLMSGSAPFPVRVQMDDWVIFAGISDHDFVISKVLCDDADDVASLLIELASSIPSLYLAYIRYRRCDRGPVLADQGIAIGLAPDDPDGIEISRWLNAYADKTWGPFLKDVFRINIFSADALKRIKVGEVTLGEFIERSDLGSFRWVGPDRLLWELSEVHRVAARDILLQHDVLVVGHAAGTLSQTGVDSDTVYEAV